MIRWSSDDARSMNVRSVTKNGKPDMKNLLVFLILLVAAAISLVEGTVSMLSGGRIVSHLGLKLGKWSERFY